jgi:hypothetical protein
LAGVSHSLPELEVGRRAVVPAHLTAVDFHAVQKIFNEAD